MVISSSSIEKSFRIKHEDNKFLSKLLSKENSKAAASIPSFRVYYNDVPSSVPFIWELQPGTPKLTFSQTSLLPPLSPPPSYYSNTNNYKKPIKNNSRSNIFHALIMKLNPKKSLLPPSPSYSSSSTLSWSSSSSQYSSISAPTTPSHLIQQRRFCSQGSSFDDYNNEEISPASKFCFGNKATGGYSVFTVKKALFSIVGGRGSN